MAQLLAAVIDSRTASYLLAGIHTAQRLAAHDARTNGTSPPSCLDALEQAVRGVVETNSDQFRPDQTGKQTVDLSDGQAGIDERKFYSRAEIAEMSGLNERKIYRLIAAGKLPETVLGIPRAAIERLGLDHKEKP